MPLVSMKKLLQEALDGSYAIGYFEPWNLESLSGVIEAAEETHSPVIIGFGCTLMDENWLNSGGLEILGAVGGVVARRATVPVSLILNEAATFQQVVLAIKYGFNVVTMDNAHLPFEANVEMTKKIVEIAHPVGVCVEAELGQLPAGTTGIFPTEGSSLTDPEEAAQFVNQTGIDALAVSIGNVHVLIEGEAQIDVDRLRKIREMTDIPLVIHGGSGFPDEFVGEVIKLGVAKFNVGTILKQAFFNAMKEKADEIDGPLRYIAMGSRRSEDILSAGRLKMKETVKRLLKVYGSLGKAG